MATSYAEAAPKPNVTGFRAALHGVMKADGIEPHLPPPKAARDAATACIGPTLTLEQLADMLYADKASEFPMSASQRVLCRAVDGNGTAGLVDADTHRFHFGTADALPILGSIGPKVIYCRSGIRCGKTYFAAIGVLKCALTCSTRRKLTAAEVRQGRKPDADGKVPVLQPGERITVFFCTPKAEQSAKAFGYVVSAVTGSPHLAPLITKSTTEHLRIRRPHDGVEVDFVMVAASPRGTNIRSGWLAAALFDESAFFDDDAEAAVNLNDNLNAATSRLLEGGQVWLPSSPWADSGTWHEEIKKLLDARDGVVNGSRTAVAFHSDSYTLNPALDPKLREDQEAKDPIEAQREYDAVPISALTNLWFTTAALAKSINPARTPDSGLLTLPPIAGVPHYAGVDLGYRKNSSTIVVSRNDLRETDAGSSIEVAVVAYHEELIPPKDTPLMPSAVTQQFASVCQEYGCPTMRGDSYDTPSAIDNLCKISGPRVTYDEYIPTMERNAALFTRALELMVEGRVEIPADPRLLGQLKRVQKRVLPGGRTQVMLPKQGRAHADLVVALVHSLVQAGENSGGRTTRVEYDATYDRYMKGVTMRTVHMTATTDDEDEGGGLGFSRYEAF